MTPRNREQIAEQMDRGSDYTPDEIEFLKAMDRYKRVRRRPFPTWHEVLEVLVSLGYRKVPETRGARE